ncbi:MAG: di-trans,poly-cis-decaprenylcistransferase [Epsilonproteobacteria bacterium]|nr:MAG: di-trans,poly-cis-decaprenylcistransferase [Campylobacterota bacterium]RLA66275.1 MAG: di-trans,poly-cis-decaprenylcistransferase [Campylobacterota bacterium]
MNSLNHVAIIMDGNGRWAQSRGHLRVWGHVRGSKIVSEIVEEADNLGVKHLTLFTFSTENWSRPIHEIKILFRLLKKFLQKEKKRIIQNKIKFKVIGDISDLPQSTKDLIWEMEELTKNMDGLRLTFCFNYGGRSALVDKVNQLVENNIAVTEGNLCESFEVGDVDLLIRTGGDQRISNFLLWQMAYSELYFTPTQWPEFSAKEFREIFSSVSKRERRFGMVAAVKDWDTSSKQAQINKEGLGQMSEG